MKVLITGATGLVGGAIAQHFVQKKMDVYCLVRPESNWHKIEKISTAIHLVEGDILDVSSLENAMKGMDYVVHAAAIVSFSPKNRTQMYQVNVEGTANVVNCAHAEKSIKKLVFISSIAALGRPSSMEIAAGNPITENQKWENSPLNSHYAISKFQAECEVWRGHAEGLPVAILNPTIILGEGDWTQSSTQLFKYVFDENKFLTEGYINYVDVQDVAKLTELVMCSDINGERFIVNAGRVSYKMFFTHIAQLLHKKAPSIVLKGWLLEILWRLESVRSFITQNPPLITKETAKSASLALHYPSDKVKNTFGNVFVFTPLDTSLARITHYLKKKYQSNTQFEN
ncbi:MAG: SDR family NAD(P)-dependent oxidoreductase [Spirosomataceae bacterium]